MQTIQQDMKEMPQKLEENIINEMSEGPKAIKKQGDKII